MIRGKRDLDLKNGGLRKLIFKKLSLKPGEVKGGGGRKEPNFRVAR
jgi:hypothetical protein